MPEVEEEINDHDDWFEDEDEGSGGVPECVWFDGPVDVVPPTPQVEVDRAADAFEVERLTEMGVMRPAATRRYRMSSRRAVSTTGGWRLENWEKGKQCVEEEIKTGGSRLCFSRWSPRWCLFTTFLYTPIANVAMSLFGATFKGWRNNQQLFPWCPRAWAHWLPGRISSSTPRRTSTTATWKFRAYCSEEHPWLACWCLSLVWPCVQVLAGQVCAGVLPAQPMPRQELKDDSTHPCGWHDDLWCKG